MTIINSFTAVCSPPPSECQPTRCISVAQELHLYLEKVSQLLRAGGRVQSSTGGAWNGGAAGGAGSLGLHPDPDADYQRAVLASLATDPGDGSTHKNLGRSNEFYILLHSWGVGHADH